MNTKKRIEFITENELCYGANPRLLKILAGGSQEAKEAREKDYIPDLFSCDPDYFRINGSGRQPYVTYEFKTVLYIITTHELEDDEQTMLKAFYSNDFRSKFDKPDWEDWTTFDYKIASGIAYRNGAGYCYAIWEYYP